MNFPHVNSLAVLVSGVAIFVLGGLWYAPFLFGGAWKRANGFGAEEPPPAGTKVFVISFVLSVVMALNLAMFLNDPKTNMAWGATAGFLAVFGWVVMGVEGDRIHPPWAYTLGLTSYDRPELVVTGLPAPRAAT